jgi:hypothetical protein
MPWVWSALSRITRWMRSGLEAACCSASPKCTGVQAVGAAVDQQHVHVAHMGEVVDGPQMQLALRTDAPADVEHRMGKRVSFPEIGQRGRAAFSHHFVVREIRFVDRAQRVDCAEGRRQRMHRQARERGARPEAHRHRVAGKIEIGRRAFTETVEVESHHMKAGIEQRLGVAVAQPEALAGKAHRVGAHHHTARGQRRARHDGLKLAGAAAGDTHPFPAFLRHVGRPAPGFHEAAEKRLFEQMVAVPAARGRPGAASGAERQ